MLMELSGTAIKCEQYLRVLPLETALILENGLSFCQVLYFKEGYPDTSSIMYEPSPD